MKPFFSYSEDQGLIFHDGAEGVRVEGTVMQQTEDCAMGNTWEIQVWKPIEWRGGEYGYEEFWRGQSWMAAAWNFLKAKREGHGCVTLHWR